MENIKIIFAKVRGLWRGIIPVCVLVLALCGLTRSAVAQIIPSVYIPQPDGQSSVTVNLISQIVCSGGSIGEPAYKSLYTCIPDHLASRVSNPRGELGLETQVTLTPSGDTLSQRQFRIKSGPDMNGNNILDDSEVCHTTLVIVTRLKIIQFHDGNETDITDKTINVLVGESIELQARLVPLEGLRSYSTRWSIPGYLIQKYIYDKNRAQMVPLSSGALARQDIFFKWRDAAGAQKVSVEVKFAGNTYNQECTFNIETIQFNFVANTAGVSGIRVDNNYDGTGRGFLHFGQINNMGPYAIDLRTTQVQWPAGQVGEIWYVQLMDRQLTKIYEDGTQRMIAVRNVLDERFPAFPDGGISVADRAVDAPALTIEPPPPPANPPSSNTPVVEIKVKDTYRMYLMVKKLDPDSIPIPIQVTTWGWSAHVVKQNGTWNFVTPPTARPLNTQPTKAFPQYNDNIKNHKEY